MTQISRIQADRTSNGFLDSGPYSADQWGEMFSTMFTANPTSEGPLVNYLNELEGDESTPDIEVETGAGLCAGRFFHNDALVPFTPAAPAANPRIDVACLMLNNTALPITAGTATANNLIFPNNLTDYEGTASLPAFSVRLAILPGNEAGAPVAPTLDTNIATLFMVPLYQYQLSVGGAFSGQADRREFCHTNFQMATDNIEDEAVTADKIDNRTRRANFNLSPLTCAVTAGYGYTFVDAAVRTLHGNLRVPSDFASSGQIITMGFSPGATGVNQAYVTASTKYASNLQAYNLHTGSNADSFKPLAANQLIARTENVVASLAAGDEIILLIERDGNHVNDTLSDDLYITAVYLEYTADS